MKRIAPTLLLVVALTVVVGAQPQHGDLAIAVGGLNGGFAGHVSAVSGTLTPLSTLRFATWVRMADNNSDLVVAEFRASNSNLLHVHPVGGSSVRGTLTGMLTDGYALDEDGWIGCSRTSSKPLNLSHLYHASLTTTATPSVTTLWTKAMPIDFNEMAIDRDPGSGAPYVLACCCSNGPGTHPMLLRADRQGNLTPILTTQNSPFLNLRAVEIDPRTGDYLLLDPNVGLCRVGKAGAPIKTLLTPLNASALKVSQDGHAWIAANAPDRILKYDLAANTVVSIYGLPPQNGMALQGIEVYGSRTLVCSHQPLAPTARVAVRSRVLSIRPNLTCYVLAASLARRPGLRFPGTGEWLDLDVTGPLFLLSAQGLLPGVFQGFQGTLGGGNGVATAFATVNIPWQLRGSRIPVFVAGVLYDLKTGVVRQVTNTHWFVM